MAVDTKKLEQFLGQFVTDLGATVHAGMVVIGELSLTKILCNLWRTVIPPTRPQSSSGFGT